MSNSEENDFARTTAIEERGKELAAEWLANDSLEFLFYMGDDSFSPGDTDILRRWLASDQDDAATARLNESASRVIQNFVRGYALARGLRVADGTRTLMDTHFADRIRRL